MDRKQWTPSDFGRAMAAYVEAHAKHPRPVKRRGCACVESEAFHRKGDNPTSLLVNEDLGSFADARAGVSGNARDFARVVASMDLVAFMAAWGRDDAAPQRPTHNVVDEEHAAEACALLARASDLDVDDATHAWAIGRGLDTARIVERGLARALPLTGTLPRWAAFRGDWRVRGYRVIVPAYDDNGAIVSVHARKITPLLDEQDKKAVHPVGGRGVGRVMADRFARALLAGDEPARGHVVDVSRRTNRPGVVVVEGVPAWLKWATDASDADDAAPAVIGVWSGSWTADIAARVPDGARVWVDVDHDDSGDGYAQKILATLGKRAEIFRVTHTKAAA